MNPKLKSNIFGRRVTSWYVISKLMERLDSGHLLEYPRTVVKFAIGEEIMAHVVEIWGKTEA